MNCQESSCAKSQVAICLHCLCRLCSTHLLAHREEVVKHTVQVSKQINGVAQELDVLLQKVRCDRQSATSQLRTWRQCQIDQVERIYTERFRDIARKKDRINTLETELTERVMKEAKTIHENIQRKQSLQAIAEIVNENIRSIPPEHQHQSPSLENSSTRKTIEPPSIIPFRKLVNRFKIISGTSDQYLNRYISKNLLRLPHDQMLMTLLVSLFQAWYSSNTNDQILSYHMNTIKKYIQKPEHQLAMLTSILIFVTSSNRSDDEILHIFNALLQFFWNNQFFTKETLLNWCHNEKSNVYRGFERIQPFAQSFLDQL
ncbi:unnamed protein product [Adineta ricciae]|uniref:Uncharacterized protein n=1 Tax=Adineta ricciae TaxID=249248 RepID=A0A813ZFJ7_ADIRI|nr:unnamed protein product [Adineta ricciae]CAF1315790.1 unnamed protein product [Adineta ricciae]